MIDDGALIIKCWLHLKKEEQKDRLKKLEKNPETSWQVTERDKKHLKMYDDFIGVAEKVLMETSTGNSPWLIVDGSDLHYSSLRVGQHILDRIRQHIGQREAEKSKEIVTELPKTIQITQQSVLDSLDLSLKLEKKDYQQQLALYQGKLNKLSREAHERKRSCTLVFEGWDAGGKGGAIRRITHAVDARMYHVIPIAAPTDEENRHHYLWRFWRHLSRAGRFTIFDRSWYGRVLVERVEGFATEPEWRRAYAEINDFEDQLIRSGIVLCKFWLHISKEEQLARFKLREETPYKRWKLTDEDWRNREKWDEYEVAVNDMVAQTSTRIAPWILVEGNDKRYARIKVLKAICRRLHERLKDD